MSIISKPLAPEQIAILEKGTVEFKDKAWAFYTIVYTYSKKYGQSFVPNDHIKSELDKFVFFKGYISGTVGFKTIRKYLLNGGVISASGVGVSYSDFISAKKTPLVAKQYIKDTPVPQKYFKDILSVHCDFVDRRGWFGFTDEHTENIIDELKILNKLAQQKTLTAQHFSNVMYQAIRNILGVLMDFKNSDKLFKHIRTRFKIGRRNDFLKYIMSTYNKLHENKKNAITSICHGITTLSNIFNSNDVKRFGFDKDTTEIKNTISEIYTHVRNHMS